MLIASSGLTLQLGQVIGIKQRFLPTNIHPIPPSNRLNRIPEAKSRVIHVPTPPCEHSLVLRFILLHANEVQRKVRYTRFWPTKHFTQLALHARGAIVNAHKRELLEVAVAGLVSLAHDVNDLLHVA